MLPVQKIVCPTDFSDFSYRALDTAVELCREFGARLTIIHVIGPIPKAMDAPTSASFNVSAYQKKLEEDAETMLQDVTKNRIPDGIETETSVVHGSEAESIVKASEESGAGLIVIATHGRTGITHLLLGSVTEKVLRHTTIPVLTIHPSS